MPLIRNAETGRGSISHKYSLRHSAKSSLDLLNENIDASRVRNKTDFLLSLGLRANVISSSFRKAHSDGHNNNIMECSVVIETVKCIICGLYFKCRTDMIDHWKTEKCNMSYMRQCKVVVVGVKCKFCGRNFKCDTDVKLHVKTKHRIRKKSTATVIIKIGEEVVSKVCVRKKHLKARNVNSGMLPYHWKRETNREAKKAEDVALNSFFDDYYVTNKKSDRSGDSRANGKTELHSTRETSCSAYAATCGSVRVMEEKSVLAISNDDNILVKREKADDKTDSGFTKGNLGSDCASEIIRDKFGYSLGNDLPSLNDDTLISEFDQMSDIGESDRNDFEMGYREIFHEIHDARTVPCLYNEILMVDDEVLLLEDFENMERAKNEFFETDSNADSTRRMSLSDVSSTLSDAERFDDDDVVELIRIFNPTANCGGRDINEVSPTRRERELLMRCNIPDNLDSKDKHVRLQNEKLNCKAKVEYSNLSFNSALE